MRIAFRLRRRQQGFTLIELLIVIGIIGLLATLAVVSLTSAQQKARDAKRIADLKTMETSLALYWNQNAQYPNPTPGSGDDGWAVLGTAIAPYISVLPVDPMHKSGGQYVYMFDTKSSDKFVLAVQLEDANQTAFLADIDTDFSVDTTNSTWVTYASTKVKLETAVNCGDTERWYCVMGDATR